MVKVTGLVGLCVLLSACGGVERPSLYAFTPASVMVNYDESDLYAAAQTAQDFCRSSNRDAQYVRSEDDDAKLGFFNCVGGNTGVTQAVSPLMIPAVMPMMGQPMLPASYGMMSGNYPAQAAPVAPVQMAALTPNEPIEWDDQVDWKDVFASQ